MGVLRYWQPFTLGLVAFTGAHAIEASLWLRWFGGEHDAWFLNSGRAVAFTLSCVFVASVIATARSGGPVVQGLTIAAGAIAAMTVILLFTGQGSLFPIVIAMGGGLIILSSVAGAFLGAAVSGRR